MKIQPSRLAKFSDKWFQSRREEFAAMLAAGETLNANGKPLLSFEELDNRLYPDNQAELHAAMQLCAISPELGGKHVKRVLEAVALELVDTFESAFRADYERELNRSEAA